jgi:enhancer of mRNA-decapping protein 4
MREMMIPAYESATRQMFQQTTASLEQGLAKMSVNQTNAAAPTLQSMLTQMSEMNEAIQSLSMEVAQLRGSIDANSVNLAHSVPSELQEAAAQPIGIRDEILALCQAQRYEEAFTKAVSASNGDVVLFACKHSDADAVFNGDVHISQPIMICLLQQLGAVLVPATDCEDIKTILLWLQEIAVTIDPSNISIQRRKIFHLIICKIADI